MLPSRPDDRAGLSFVYARVSPLLTDVQDLEESLDEPLSNAAPGVQTNEELVELNYNIAAFRGVDLMPDLQWVIHPSGSTRYPDALVLGLQIAVRF